jgi:hypothetical protein
VLSVSMITVRQPLGLTGRVASPALPRAITEDEPGGGHRCQSESKWPRLHMRVIFRFPSSRNTGDSTLASVIKE